LLFLYQFAPSHLHRAKAPVPKGAVIERH
jgi:hypothetical protein